MKIRAPKSGYVTVEQQSGYCAEGAPLFRFDQNEEALAVSKAALALSLVEMLHARLLTLDKTDIFTDLLVASIDAVETVRNAFHDLEDHRRIPAEQGIIEKSLHLQAISLKLNSRGDYETVDVASDFAQLNINEYKILLPIQISYCQEVLALAQLAASRCQIVAPVAGDFHIVIPSGVWVKRNDIIAIAEKT